MVDEFMTRKNFVDRVSKIIEDIKNKEPGAQADYLVSVLENSGILQPFHVRKTETWSGYMVDTKVEGWAPDEDEDPFMGA